MVDIANVPQDHRGLGASLWIAILGSFRISISRERWYLKGAGGEGFFEGSMELKLHARGFREVLRKGVNDGPVFR